MSAANLYRFIVACLLTAKAFSSNFANAKFPKMNPVDWPHKPVFVQAGSDTKVIGRGSNRPVPLGVPFEIESPLFEGRALLRFRNAKSDDPDTHGKYFEGLKRLMQTVIQGRFKRPIKMSEVYVGSIFALSLADPPPPILTKVMDAVIRRVAPGVILDLSSTSPRVVALLAGAAETMSIDPRGEEPDMTSPGIEENVASALGEEVATRCKRKKLPGNPEKASSYRFDTENVYTFHMYDDAMDYGRGTMHIPMYGEYDIKSRIGRQPLSLTAVTRDGDVLYDLRIWHESLYE